MKKLYFLVVFIMSFVTQAQIVNIPDANFKAKLLSASSTEMVASTETPIYNSTTSTYSVSSYNVIDLNGDGEIQQSEAQNIKYLSISNYYISSLVGIEAFVNLEYLDCESNNLSNLDLSQNTNIKYLQCSYNQINSLNVTHCIDLVKLHCYNNNLTSIDLIQNLSLDYIFCTSNQITSLDLSFNALLEYLICDNNQLSSLNIAQNQVLKYLSCNSNLLSELDVSSNQNLELLSCADNQLISLFLKNNNVIWDFYTSNNGNTLSFGNNPDLKYICADDDDIDMILQKIINYGITNCHANSYCSFTPGGGLYYTIQGNTKLDLDSNGCDNSDLNFPYMKFLISNGTSDGTIISDASGNYSIALQAGSYTITPVIENPTYFNISPINLVVNFPNQTSPLIQDFCVSLIAHHNVEVIYISIIPARPGFDAHYKIIYKNKGNQIENGTITLDFDDTVSDLVSANPAFSSQATNSLDWNYSNLQPFETRTINVVFNVNGPIENPAVDIGDQLNYTATITPLTTDEFQYDNTSSLKQIVVGSYDPNDKTCIEGTTVGPDMIGQYMHYVIRFENTGNYPAQNVVVKDMIDLTKFDVSTLTPLHSSHDFVTRINADKVEFIFEGINLPFDDATNDGYVAFKIKTKPNLVVGNTFSNNANIYFDYNFPITTNTFTTTIAALKVKDFDFGSHFTLYPNPVKDVLNLQSKDNTKINSIEIYNTLGQIVLAVPNTVSTVDVSSLKSGNYFIKVNTDLGVSNTKFIKE